MFIAERPYKHTLSSSLQLTFKEWYKSKLKTSATSRLQNKENEIYNLDPFHFFFSFCAALVDRGGDRSDQTRIQGLHIRLVRL
jgi:hypothetical protein